MNYYNNFLNKINLKKKKKYCFFKKNNIKFIDYKNPNFLKKFLNEFGKILSKKITGVSLKYQRKLKKSIKRCRFLALLPYVTNNLK
ncbi:MAG: 30S ribosomal protein S18 [Candidatus Shikimatogenerans sp. Ttur]|uniref:Small ribosomal subunit protein bS18 n=1 Tax=Candidatus Shikimatogenerans sp. Ttur TaxID=3158569 RepID=A0AAU7ZXK2_9FLAO